MIVRTVLAISALSLFPVLASAQAKGDKGPPGPCKQIMQACQQAGFIKGDYKKGDGILRDCVDPIMQGQTNVPGATKPLPAVDAKLVADCKAKRPKFGSGKVGSTK